ncbi:MAG: glycosyltransferase family 4 protein [Nitrospina sp.]|jgi:glycosyltransferase involved in cell wall biosynthesis|nr:glycosyltransferase family 4 protein [Nitrospina sp.]MBT6600938.1 glycosyltransferase family 4 protein [Nitrospina sp.]
MIQNVKKNIKKKGRYYFQTVIKHYGKLKPFFFWVSPSVRAYFKTAILRVVFKLFYSIEPDTFFDKGFKKGINLIGYPLADIGEGEFIRQTARSLSRANVDFGVHNFNFETRLDQNNQELVSLVQSSNFYLVNIFHLKPDQIEASIIRYGESFVSGHFNIGYWTWELSKHPIAWMNSLNYFHEIWCPSHFIESAVSDSSSRSAIYMPPAFDLEEPKEFNRSYYNLPENRFLFLFVFDFKSSFYRKNPLGCIQAFQNAFPNINEGVGLVLKSMDGEKYIEEFKYLNTAVKSDPRIKIINAVFSSDEVIGLMNICDVFVSLHRSEGIGLSIAQSMLLGKPVIATNYSGNTDFTRSDNSCIVDYKLIEVKKGEYPFFKGQTWADPNIDQASSYMHRLVEDDTYRTQVAKAGHSYVKTHHNIETVGKNYRRRLIELGLLNS